MVAWKDSEQEPALLSPSSASASAGFAGQVESLSLPSSGAREHLAASLAEAVLPDTARCSLQPGSEPAGAGGQ